MSNWISYERYSSDLQNPRSVAQQYDDNMRAEGGTTAAHRFSEPETSGTTDPDERPAFSSMLARLREEPFKYRVRCWDLERFGRFRTPDDFFYWKKTLLRAGALELVFTTGNMNTGNALADFVVTGIGAHGAGEFSRKVSQRVTRGFRDQAKRGFWCGGLPPYGYDALYEGGPGARPELVKYTWEGTGWRKDVYDPKTLELIRRVPGGTKFQAMTKPANGRLVLGDAARVAVVREIFKTYIEGLGLRRIAENLNKRKVPSPRDAGWNVQTVRQILDNPAYTGRPAWGRRTCSKLFVPTGPGQARERTEAECRQKSMKVDGSGRKKKIMEFVPIVAWTRAEEGAAPAIVAPETYQVVQELMKTRREKEGPRGRGRGSGSQNAYSGLIHCSKCQQRYVGISFGLRVGKAKSRPAYVCGTYNMKGRVACERGGIRRDEFETSLNEWVTEKLWLNLPEDQRRANVRAALVAAFGTTGNEQRGGNGLQKKLEEVEESIAAYKRMRPSVFLDFQSQYEAARAERDRLLAELAAESARTSEGQPKVDIDEATANGMEYLEKLSQALHRGTPSEQRLQLGKFVVNIEYHASDRRAVVYYYDPAHVFAHFNSATACRS